VLFSIETGITRLLRSRPEIFGFKTIPKGVVERPISADQLDLRVSVPKRKQSDGWLMHLKVSIETIPIRGMTTSTWPHMPFFPRSINVAELIA
jgi:hypothetical protein